MADNDILKVFEGLTKEQAQALRAVIVPTLKQIREEILSTRANGDSQKGKAKMNDDFDNPYSAVLSDEEQAEVKREYEKIAAKVVAKRREGQTSQLIEEYKAAMLAVRGQPHRLKEVKARFKNKGLNVDSVDFTGTGEIVSAVVRLRSHS